MENLENKHNDNVIAYLTGELDEKRMNDIKKEKSMQKQLDEYKELWDKSGELSDIDKIDINADWSKVKGRMGFKQQTKKIPFNKFILRIASVLILAFGMTYLFTTLIKQVPDSKQNVYFTETATTETKVVELPDGSNVALNIGASIYYNNNFGEVNRDIILEGEAFFDVQRNEELPFKVFVANSTVEVLGTSFNIQSNNEEVLLCVVSGKVAFFETGDKSNRVELVQDEMIVYKANAHRFNKKEHLDINTLAWHTGNLSFKGVPLNEVFEIVATSYNMTLEISKDVDVNEPFTGDFNDNTLEDIAYAIETAAEQPLSITVKKNKIIIEK